MVSTATLLAEARLAANLTQREAAALLGVHRTTIQTIERGSHRPPPLRVAWFLARYEAHTRRS